MSNLKVWVYYRGDHNIGGGGASVKIYSSAEIAIEKNPGNWQLQNQGEYKSLSADYWEPEFIYLMEVDSEQEI